jgi:hypothetical protein
VSLSRLPFMLRVTIKSIMLNVVMLKVLESQSYLALVVVDVVVGPGADVIKLLSFVFEFREN